MSRMFETSEITKLLDVMIGETDAIGETNEDKRRLDNLKTLIDVTDWCLDGLQFAMASGYGRPEYSMAEISYTAQRALDEFGRWIADVLNEQMADCKTEPQRNMAEDIVESFGFKAKSYRQAKAKTEPQTDCEACELDGKADVCKVCRVSYYKPQPDCAWK